VVVSGTPDSIGELHASTNQGQLLNAIEAAPARAIKPDQPACAHLTQPALLDQSSNRHLPRHRLQTFFPSRSFSAALSSIASASSFFSRRFSSSSDFNRRASETSIPPYFTFHL